MEEHRRSWHPAACFALCAGLIPSPALASDPAGDQCLQARQHGQQLQREGKLAEARAALDACASASCSGSDQQPCVQLRAQVDASVPTVIFDVRDTANRPVTSARITVDGQVLAGGAEGSAVPLDPGPHGITFAAPGLRPQSLDLTLREGDKNHRERVVLLAPSEEPPDGDLQRVLGLSLAGAGLAAVALAIDIGVGARNTYESTLGTSCGRAAGFAQPSVCTASGVNQVQGARVQAATATGFLIAAPLLLIGGAVVFLTAQDAPGAVGRGAGATTGALNIRGQW